MRGYPVKINISATTARITATQITSWLQYQHGHGEREIHGRLAFPNLIVVSPPVDGPAVAATVVFPQEKCHESERHGHGRWPLICDLSQKKVGRT